MAVLSTFLPCLRTRSFRFFPRRWSIAHSGKPSASPRILDCSHPLLSAVTVFNRRPDGEGTWSIGRTAADTLDLFKVCQLSVKQFNPRQFVAKIPQMSSFILAKGASIAYIAAGDPDFSPTTQALKVLESYGSGIIDLGVPYPDPQADDPVIHAASTRSLARVSNFDAVISMLKVALRLPCPVALFLKYSPILKLVVEKFMSIFNDSEIQGPRPPTLHDVFISYEQDDMLHPVSHLKSALGRRGIETFVDFTLDEGVEFQPAIHKAIERSEIAILIVSQNFHKSPWCLEELMKVLECREKWGLIVVPIFWGIEAKKLREQPRHFVKNIGISEKGLKQQKPDQVHRWSDALRALGRINGWRVNSSLDKTEAEVIEDFADKISAKLKRSG